MFPVSYIDIKPPFGASYVRDQNNVLNLLLNEGCGNKVFDSSYKENHGIIHGATWFVDRGGYALNFTAENYVEVPDFEVVGDSGKQVTISIDFRTPNSSAEQTFIGKDAVGDQSIRMRVVSGKFEVILSEDGGAINRKAYRATTTILNDVKYTYSFTFNGNNANSILENDQNDRLKLFINGQREIASVIAGLDANITTINNNSVPLFIGRERVSEGDFAEGVINKILVFDRALFASEVFQAYLNPYAKYQTPLNLAIFGGVGVGSLINAGLVNNDLTYMRLLG